VTADRAIALGRVLKPVGLRGEVKLLPLPDFWAGGLDSDRLELRRDPGAARGARAVRVSGSRPSGDCVVLSLEGVADRDAAEALRDAVLVLEGEPDVALPDEVLPFQVKGLAVRGRDGRSLGEAVGLEPMPAQPLLIVRDEREGGREHMVPFVAPILVAVDLEAGVIELDPPPGLLEL
jgi:16S rRNA processing protein RimM